MISDETIYFSSKNGAVHAVDAGTLKKLWSFERNIKSKWFSYPSIADSVLYWSSGDSHVYAISLQSGMILWKFDAGAPAGTPVPNEEKVLFCAGNSLFALE